MTEEQRNFKPQTPDQDLIKFEDRGPGVPAVQDDSNGFMAMVERLSANPDVDVEKLKGILDMQERVLDRNAEQAFNAGMTRAQNKIELVVAKSFNEQTKSNYAKLKEVLLKAKPIYTAEGFSLMFYEGETNKENHKRICVDIMHEQGHTKTRYGDFAIQTTGIAGKAMMTQIHGEGSCFSYGRRYLTCSIFNIPTGDDDDGNAAGSTAEFITEDQAKSINKRLEAIYGDDPGMFLTYIGVEKVNTIPASDLKKVKIALAEAEKAFAKKRATVKKSDQQMNDGDMALHKFGREPGSDDE